MYNQPLDDLTLEDEVQTVAQTNDDVVKKIDELIQTVIELDLEQSIDQAEIRESDFERLQVEKLEQSELIQQQQQAEQEFRDELLAALSDVDASLQAVNANTLFLLDETEKSNLVFGEVFPYVEQASEWFIIAVVILACLWVLKQFEDMFDSAFR